MNPADVKQEIMDIMENALCLAGYKVLDGDRDGFVIRRVGSQVEDPDYEIKITDIFG